MLPLHIKEHNCTRGRVMGEGEWVARRESWRGGGEGMRE